MTKQEVQEERSRCKNPVYFYNKYMKHSDAIPITDESFEALQRAANNYLKLRRRYK